jgi:hypothetical protein
VKRLCWALLAAGALLGGCSGPPRTATPGPDPGGPRTPKPEHTPPHGGGLSELGEEAAHLEALLDPSSGRLDLYLLDGEAENAQPTEKRQSLLLRLSEPGPADLSLQPVADPLSGETAEHTSHFQAMAPLLKGQRRFRGVLLRLELRGELYREVPVAFPEGVPEQERP